MGKKFDVEKVKIKIKVTSLGVDIITPLRVSGGGHVISIPVEIVRYYGLVPDDDLKIRIVEAKRIEEEKPKKRK